jgi:hypothetical protein
VFVISPEAPCRFFSERGLKAIRGFETSQVSDKPVGDLASVVFRALWCHLTQEIAVSGAPRRGIHVEPVLRRGPPWDKILNVATEYGAEMIVVGSRGQRGAIRGLPLGSVATRVLALSSRSVLVARGDE